MPAYVPPALRGISGQQDAQARLSERVWRVKLEYSSGGPFDVAECPEELLPLNDVDQLPEVTVRQFELPSEVSSVELKALLSWFARASSASSEQHPHGDAKSQLLFPPSLSKENRKLLHQLAQGLGLPTFSKGLGEERRLAIHGCGFRDTPEMEAEVAAVAARRRAPAAIRERAKQIWRWCQADGGALWSISQGELEEALLAAPDESSLPTPVKDLLERREHGTALINAIRAGDSAAALAVLQAHPRAAWIRDDSGGPSPGPQQPGAPQQQQQQQGPQQQGSQQQQQGLGAPGDSGYYPLHLAALAGLGEVVEAISAQPGAVEQRDRNYATPLKVAKKAGQTAMVELLLSHGAKDYEINQAAHKTAAVGIPLPPGGHGAHHGRRPSNSNAPPPGPVGSLGHHSYGGSPRVGSPAGLGGASGSSPHSAGSYMAAHAASRQRRMSNDGPGSAHRSGAQQHGGGAQHGGGHGGGGAQQGHHHGHHGPSSLGSAHRASGPGSVPAGGSGRRSIDEHHHHHHPSQPGSATAAGAAAAANDPTINPFALLANTATGDRSGSSSRRSSAGGGLPPRPHGSSGGGAEGADAGAAEGEAAAAAAAAPIAIGGGGGRSGRSRNPPGWVPLPPIQSGEVSEASVAAALAEMGLSAKPGLPTAAEGPEGAAAEDAAGGGAAGSGDEDAGSVGGGAGDDGAPKKRKTRRGRRGRGNRRQSNASTDEVATAAVASAVAAAAAAGGGGGVPASAPVASGQQLLKEFMSQRSAGAGSAGAASGGGDSSDRSVSDGSDSDGSAGGRSGSRTRRGGQPARARRHERRRAARVSGADGGGGGGDGRHHDRGGGRRTSGAEYSSFHQGHAYGHGHGGNRGGHQGGHQGGHYNVFGGGGHQGHADDAASWRRDPATASPAAPPMAGPLRDGPDEPRLPAAARPPAPRRMSAGGPPPSSMASAMMAGGASGGGAGPMGTPGGSSGGAAAGAEAPGSPFHFGGAHGPREHVAAGPAVGTGFGFGRGRGRGQPSSGGAPGAPGSGHPSAPGSPMRAAAAPGPSPIGASTLGVPAPGSIAAAVSDVAVPPPPQQQPTGA